MQTFSSVSFFLQVIMVMLFQYFMTIVLKGFVGKIWWNKYLKSIFCDSVIGHLFLRPVNDIMISSTKFLNCDNENDILNRIRDHLIGICEVFNVDYKYYTGHLEYVRCNYLFNYNNNTPEAIYYRKMFRSNQLYESYEGSYCPIKYTYLIIIYETAVMLFHREIPDYRIEDYEKIFNFALTHSQVTNITLDQILQADSIEDLNLFIINEITNRYYNEFH